MSIEGVWQWSYNGGAFEVNFAPGSEFVCKAYPAHAHWAIQGNKLSVTWGRFGNYDMTVSSDGKSMEGFYVGYPEDWRKAQFVRAHTAEEIAQFLVDASHAHNHEHHHDHGTCSGHH
jgi:hypothetical protein